MEEMKSKVYVLLDSEGRITRCEGGYTTANIQNVEEWVKIDEGTGDRYNLCQSNYFPQPIMTMGGAYRYKLVDGKPVECPPEEIREQEEARKPVPAPTLENRVESLEADSTEMKEALEMILSGVTE